MAQPAKARGKLRPKREKPEFDQHIVDLARVTRVTEGGKHLSFRACVVIGDRKGRVGFGVDKGPDVQIAVEKAVNQAKKNLIRIPFINETIPHRVEAKFKAAKVMLKPAPRGSGVIAGSAIRVILEMAGVPNASSKMLGKTSNKIANVKAVFEALNKFTFRVKSTPVSREIKKEEPAPKAGKGEKKESAGVPEKKKAPAKTSRKKAATNKAA